jgi:hypothetical protein
MKTYLSKNWAWIVTLFCAVFLVAFLVWASQNSPNLYFWNADNCLLVSVSESHEPIFECVGFPR